MRAVDPIKFTFADGVERNLLLTHAGYRRAMKQHSVGNPDEMMQAGIDVIGTVLYQSLPKDARAAMTEDDFAEILPLNIRVLTGLFQDLLGVSVPDDGKLARPPMAAPAAAPIPPANSTEIIG